MDVLYVDLINPFLNFIILFLVFAVFGELASNIINRIRRRRLK